MPVISYSRGIWLFWNDFDFDIHMERTHSQFIHSYVVPKDEEPKWALTIVCGSPRVATRQSLWEGI